MVSDTWIIICDFLEDRLVAWLQLGSNRIHHSDHLCTGITRHVYTAHITIDEITSAKFGLVSLQGVKEEQTSSKTRIIPVKLTELFGAFILKV